jgi:exosortase family protein XrtG
MNILMGLLFAFWIYLLTVVNRGKLYFFKFVLGAVGTFCFLMFLLEPYLVSLLSRMVILATGIIGERRGYYKAFYEYSLILIKTSKESISLYIDYECSGVIEILAFISLLCFFPVYNIFEKIIYCILGSLWIFLSNIIRIFIICSIVYHYGNDMFYFAHTIFGRLVFYILSIILYFYAFTKSHIKRQKLGRVSYGDDVK